MFISIILEMVRQTFEKHTEETIWKVNGHPVNMFMWKIKMDSVREDGSEGEPTGVLCCRKEKLIF